MEHKDKALTVTDDTQIELPVLPLRDVVVYPHMVIPLFVGREKSIRALDSAMQGDQKILLVAQKNAGDDEPELDAIYQMGTLASVLQLLKLPDGTVKVLVEGGRNEDSHLTRIYGYRERMPVFALAFLHDALIAGLGDRVELRTGVTVRHVRVEPGERGGIVVDEQCRTRDAAVFAIGECAAPGGTMYGLVAPGYAMAEVVVDALASVPGGAGGGWGAGPPPPR